MTETTRPRDPLEAFRLSNLPPYAKLFVAIFTALMLCVCFWAIWIYYEREGKISAEEIPAYSQQEEENGGISQVQEELNVIAEDTLAVYAPVWDTQVAGREQPIDSADIMRMARQAIAEARDEAIDAGEENESGLSHNLGLAHVHVNGQTLLFFAIGLVVLFSSAAAGTKKIVYWTGGITVLAHTIGLTGEGYAEIFEDILALSGVLLLGLFVFMAFRIFMDLAKKPVAN